MRFPAVLLSAVILLMAGEASAVANSALNACNCPNNCGYKVDSSCKYHDSIGIEDVTISGNMPDKCIPKPDSVQLASVLQHRQRHSEPPHHQIIPPPPSVDSTCQFAFDRPLWSPSGNPLPEPSREPFNSEAYKAVLNIPRGTDPFTTLYGYQQNQVQQPGQSDVARDCVRLGDVRLVPFSVLVERVNEDRHLPATPRGAEVNEIAMDGVIPPPPVLEEQTGDSPPFLVMLGPSAAPAVGPSQINAPLPVITVPRAPSADQQPIFPPESPERHVYSPNTRQPIKVSFPLSTPSIAQHLPPNRHPSTRSPQISSRPTIATQIRLCANLNHVYPPLRSQHGLRPSRLGSNLPR
ncbi:hypothetical protein EV368DRAFT_85984 [Lentinula lateritia]|nr:hypothetical protein EV368DRAFT_85984 [Lentinula lateritia]